jgi:hypothetical protein
VTVAAFHIGQRVRIVKDYPGSEGWATPCFVGAEVVIVGTLAVPVEDYELVCGCLTMFTVSAVRLGEFIHSCACCMEPVTDGYSFADELRALTPLLGEPA